MNKKLFVFLAVIMALALVSISATASPPENADGIWCYLPRLDEFQEIAVIGENTFMTFGEDSVWTGTFSGESYDAGKVRIDPSGAWFFKGYAMFDSVMVDGKTGSLKMLIDGYRPVPDVDWQGSWEIRHGTGELAGLQGQGNWSGPGWQGDPNVCGALPYTGNIYFESD